MPRGAAVPNGRALRVVLASARLRSLTLVQRAAPGDPRARLPDPSAGGLDAIVEKPDLAGLSGAMHFAQTARRRNRIPPMI